MQITDSPDQLQLTPYSGGLALVGPALSSVAQTLASGQPFQSRKLHITLVTAAEYKSIGKPSLAIVSEAISCSHIYALGLASSSVDSGPPAAWIVIVWNHADVWRKSVGLWKKQYHVTLTTPNNHDLDKGIGRLGSFDCPEQCSALVNSLHRVALDAMDQTLVACGPDLFLLVSNAHV